MELERPFVIRSQGLQGIRRQLSDVVSAVYDRLNLTVLDILDTPILAHQVYGVMPTLSPAQCAELMLAHSQHLVEPVLAYFTGATTDNSTWLRRLAAAAVVVRIQYEQGCEAVLEDYSDDHWVFLGTILAGDPEDGTFILEYWGNVKTAAVMVATGLPDDVDDPEVATSDVISTDQDIIEARHRLERYFEGGLL
jgi:hypothetical protein